MPTKRRKPKPSATRGGSRDHGRQRAATKSRTTGRRNGPARRSLPGRDRASLPDHPAGVAGVAAEPGPAGVGGAGALRGTRGGDPRSALIRAAGGAALRCADRLSRCVGLTGDGTADEADDLELDDRIARGDRMVAYDVIGACIDELTAWRDGLGEVLAGADTMARIAALAAKKERRGC